MRFLFLLCCLSVRFLCGSGPLSDQEWSCLTKHYPKDLVDALKTRSSALFAPDSRALSMDDRSFEDEHMVPMCFFLGAMQALSVDGLKALRNSGDQASLLKKFVAFNYARRFSTAFVNILISKGYASEREAYKHLFFGKLKGGSRKGHVWFHKEQVKGQNVYEIFLVPDEPGFQLIPFFSEKCIKQDNPLQKKMLFLNNHLIRDNGIVATYGGPSLDGLFPFKYQPYTGASCDEGTPFYVPVKGGAALSNYNLGFDDVAVQMWREAGQPSKCLTFFKTQSAPEEEIFESLLFLEEVRDVLNDKSAQEDEKKGAALFLEWMRAESLVLEGALDSKVHSEKTSKSRRKKKTAQKLSLNETQKVWGHGDEMSFLDAQISIVETEFKADSEGFEKILKEQEDVRAAVEKNAVPGRLKKSTGKLSKKGQGRLMDAQKKLSEENAFEIIKVTGRVKLKALNKLILRHIGKKGNLDDLKVNVKGSHMNVHTSDGAGATLAMSHGKKDRTFSGKHVAAFLNKIKEFVKLTSLGSD